MFEVFLEASSAVPISRRQVEYVERKGLGHPDTICDQVMESVSQALCRRYLEVAGRVLHHNTDKGLLVAGQTTPRLGGGSVDMPMRMIVGDRATTEVDGQPIPLREIVEFSVTHWFRDHLRFVDPSRHIVVQNELRPGSAELVGIFGHRPGHLPTVNDTSAAVGYAPLTETEHLVLAAEHFLNSHEFKHEFPETGEDVKVMGIRHGRRLQLTVAMAYVDHHLWESATYFHRKEAARQALRGFLQTKLHELDAVDVQINALDRPEVGERGMYLTVLGTSAESGDGGQVGRGNRVNGLISLSRPMTLEAAAGKNPVSHVGKIYSLLADQIAGTIDKLVDPVDEVYVWLASRIGAPLDRPASASVQVILREGTCVQDVDDRIREIVHQEVAQVQRFTERMVRGQLAVC